MYAVFPGSSGKKEAIEAGSKAITTSNLATVITDLVRKTDIQEETPTERVNSLIRKILRKDGDIDNLKDVDPDGTRGRQKDKMKLVLDYLQAAQKVQELSGSTQAFFGLAQDKYPAPFASIHMQELTDASIMPNILDERVPLCSDVSGAVVAGTKINLKYLYESGARFDERLKAHRVDYEVYTILKGHFPDAIAVSEDILKREAQGTVEAKRVVPTLLLDKLKVAEASTEREVKFAAVMEILKNPSSIKDNENIKVVAIGDFDREGRTDNLSLFSEYEVCVAFKVDGQEQVISLYREDFHGSVPPIDELAAKIEKRDETPVDTYARTVREMQKIDRFAEKGDQSKASLEQAKIITLFRYLQTVHYLKADELIARDASLYDIEERPDVYHLKDTLKIKKQLQDKVKARSLFSDANDELTPEIIQEEADIDFDIDILELRRIAKQTGKRAEMGHKARIILDRLGLAA